MKILSNGFDSKNAVKFHIQPMYAFIAQKNECYQLSSLVATLK